MKEQDRCPKYSLAWNIQCELKKGHSGICANGGDGFYGQVPGEEPQHQQESKTKKSLNKHFQRFENRLKDHLPSRDIWEGRRLTEEEKEDIAIQEVRRELMEAVAYAMDISTPSIGYVAAELALFESWVKAREM